MSALAQAEAYERFKALHERGRAFIMPNAFDAMSARLLRGAGFEALGSSSVAIANALGREDGRHEVSLEEAVANARLLATTSGLPVNGDLEDGFGPDPEDCVATVKAAIAAGLAGLGIEDTTADPARPIHDFGQAVARVRAAAGAAKGRILLTGRTDNFLHGRADLDDTIRRLTAFAEAGADVLFAPGLPDMDSVCAVVRAVAPKPVNVVVGPRATLAELDAAGVVRVSMGGVIYRAALAGVVRAADALAQGDIPTVAGMLSNADLARLMPQA